MTIIRNFLQLVIMASDQGSTQLHGFATVKIHILDVNDNAPEFLQVSLFVCFQFVLNGLVRISSYLKII